MKLSSLRDSERWERRLSVINKRAKRLFRAPCKSRPVFLLGKQRSGTTMLMHAFHRHPDLLVFDEHLNNAAFEDHRLRSPAVIRELVDQARFPVVCFKPICDSHKLLSLSQEFPNGHFIWLYRDYRDVANSTIRKFGAATRAIRLVCTGQPGGGWLQEGVSPEASATLRRIYRPTTSEFELACLTWWARNRIVVDSGLLGSPRVTPLKYEAVATQPVPMLEWLFERIAVDYRAGVTRNITARSIGRHAAPAMDAQVRELCESTLAALDRAFFAANPPVARPDSGPAGAPSGTLTPAAAPGAGTRSW